MGCGTSRGALTRLAIGGQQIRFVSARNTSNLPAIIDVSQDTIRGSYQPHADDMIVGEKVVRYQVYLEPNPVEMSLLLPYLGFENLSGAIWTPKADFGSMTFTMDVDMVAGMYTYTSAAIAKWVYAGQRGRKPFGLQLEIWGIDEADLGSWTATAIAAGTVANRPYAFHQSTLSLASTSYTPYRVAIACDFHMEDEYYNSQTVTDLCPQTWDMTFATALPWKSSTVTRYTGPRDADTRIAASFVTTGSAISTTWALPSLMALPKPPNIERRNESLKLPLRYQAARNGSSPILTITHDASP